MTKLMNAVILTGYGGPDKLVYTQVPKPQPQKGEVLIKVGACSVNNTDFNTRTGWYAAQESFQDILQDQAQNSVDTSTSWQQAGITFPRIQGADIVGTVAGIGDGVNPDILNQRVICDPWIRTGKLAEYKYIGSEIDGGFAEYTVVPVTNVYPLSSSLSDVELAAIPCAYSTAENLVTKARVSAKDTVLITGASGGVGSAAIQLCKIRGAKVVAIVGANKERFARLLGADYVYYRDEQLASNLNKHQFTVALDVVGGDNFPLLLRNLEIGGRYATSGAIAGPMVTLDLRDLIYKDLEMIGATRLESAVFQRLVDYINKDLLKPVVDKVFPLAQIHEAQKIFQTKSFFGKVVITLSI
ncbi:alcohol dehydrogenase family protein [Okeanomitos corallinicola TIOX110]|uniref:Alcohol dehydrogenase family protein n=1 Tax=Okeanomitos corallinicola TIOX110 TaxID=3133117 RepID=A0ABZ2UN64_9CYAN